MSYLQFIWYLLYYSCPAFLDFPVVLEHGNFFSKWSKKGFLTIFFLKKREVRFKEFRAQTNRQIGRRPCLQLVRWLRTVVTFPCHIVKEDQESHYEWKRIQQSEQQSMRERKNIMQKALVFSRRATKLMIEEWGMDALWGVQTFR